MGAYAPILLSFKYILFKWHRMKNYKGKDVTSADTHIILHHYFYCMKGKTYNE